MSSSATWEPSSDQRGVTLLDALGAFSRSTNTAAISTVVSRAAGSE